MLTCPQLASAARWTELQAGPVRVGSYELTLTAVPSTRGTGGVVELDLGRASVTNAGTTTPRVPQSFQTHSFAATRGVRIRIAENLSSAHLHANLGAFGHVDLAVTDAEPMRSGACATNTHVGVAQGELRLVPGGTYFKTITRFRLPISIQRATGDPNEVPGKCKINTSASFASLLSNCPTTRRNAHSALSDGPSLTIEGLPGGTASVALSVTADVPHHVLDIINVRAGCPVGVVDLIASTFPSSALTVSSDGSSATLSAFGPLLSGVANFTATTVSVEDGTTDGTVSGTLTALFDSPGPVVLAGPRFTATLVPPPPPSSGGTVAQEDAAAKALVRTAETTAETVATDNNGSYASVSITKLHAEEPTIATRPKNGSPYLSAARGSSTGYSVTVTSATGDTFTIKNVNGDITRSCVGTVGGACINGAW